MKMTRLNIQLPQALKVKLDSLRKQGYTASGYIRGLLEHDFRTREDARRGRENDPECRDLTPWKSARRSHGRTAQQKGG